MNDTKREILSPDALAPLITEVLASGGTFPFYPSGDSMLPTIRPGEDEVILASPERISVGDIVFYRRDSGVFVLHRIVGKKKDGSFVLRGDNQFYNEDGVIPSHIIAVVAEYRKGDRIVRRGSGEEKRRFLYLRARYSARRLIGGIKHRLRGGKKK
jgi:signal peptidase I